MSTRYIVPSGAGTTQGYVFQMVTFTTTLNYIHFIQGNVQMDRPWKNTFDDIKHIVACTT